MGANAAIRATKTVISRVKPDNYSCCTSLQTVLFSSVGEANKQHLKGHFQAFATF